MSSNNMNASTQQIGEAQVVPFSRTGSSYLGVVVLMVLLVCSALISLNAISALNRTKDDLNESKKDAEDSKSKLEKSETQMAMYKLKINNIKDAFKKELVSQYYVDLKSTRTLFRRWVPWNHLWIPAKITALIKQIINNF